MRPRTFLYGIETPFQACRLDLAGREPSFMELKPSSTAALIRPSGREPSFMELKHTILSMEEVEREPRTFLYGIETKAERG